MLYTTVFLYFVSQGVPMGLIFVLWPSTSSILAHFKNVLHFVWKLVVLCQSQNILHMWSHSHTVLIELIDVSFSYKCSELNTYRSEVTFCTALIELYTFTKFQPWDTVCLKKNTSRLFFLLFEWKSNKHLQSRWMFKELAIEIPTAHEKIGLGWGWGWKRRTLPWLWHKSVWITQCYGPWASSARLFTFGEKASEYHVWVSHTSDIDL